MKIKTSQGLAVLGSSFLLILALVNQLNIALVNLVDEASMREFVPAHSQIAQAAGSDVTNGLVGWWKFDEGSGTAVSDSSGSGDDGTFVNSPSWTTSARVGAGALSFDGSNQYVKLSKPETLPAAGSPFTLSVWATMPTPSANQYFALSWGESGSSNLSLFYNGSWRSGTLGGSGGLPADSWHFATAVYDGTNISMYVDGILKAGPTAWTVGSLTATYGYIGARAGQTPSLFMKGTIDDLRVYNRALSASEISQLYLYTAPPGTPAPSAVSASITPAATPGATPGASSGVSSSVSSVPGTYTLKVVNNNPANGTVTSVPVGINACASTCSLTGVAMGTLVTLTAAPNSGYSTTWAGCGTTLSGNTCIVTVGSNLTVTASFTEGAAAAVAAPAPVISNLAVSQITANSVLISYKTDIPATTQVTYGLTTNYGSNTTYNYSLGLNHNPPITGLAPATTYHYQVVSKNASGAVSTSADATFTTLAPVEASYSLTVMKSYEGSGTVTGSGINCGATCSITVSDPTQSVTLTATPSSDSVFLYWGGACSGSSPTCTVTQSVSTVVTALFQTKTAMAGPTANGILEPGEACDGNDLGGMTPLLIPGYKSGTLKCKPDRTGFDVSGLVPGNVISAASCSSADVQAAINKAQDGDTVTVPAGTCTWTTSVTAGQQTYRPPGNISKSIVLKGAGPDQTNIIAQVNGGWAFGANVQAGKSFRITGFTFDGSHTSASTGPVGITGDVGAYARVDHIKFVNLTTYGMKFYSAYGVIDHNVFSKSPTASSVSEIAFGGDITERTTNPIDSWARPLSLGTIKAIYAEDNTFIQPTPPNGPYDAYEGARYVFRYNQLYGSHIGHHGFDSGLRGTMSYEIYDNHIINNAPDGSTIPYYPHDTLTEFRSGTGVVYDNVIQKSANASPGYGYYDQFVMLRNYRSSDGYYWGSGNTANSSYCDGTMHSDGLVDGDAPGMKGYPCKDQIGRTTNQALSPTYSWNNNFQGKVGGNYVVAGYGVVPAGGVDRTYQHILEGRDYYNDVPKPGYVAYVHPHPFVQIDNSGGPISLNTVQLVNMTPPPSVAPTPTVSASVTPSVTPTVTPTITPTVTPTVIPTLTPLVVPTVIPHVTPAATRPVTPLATVRPTGQNSTGATGYAPTNGSGGIASRPGSNAPLAVSNPVVPITINDVPQIEPINAKPLSIWQWLWGVIETSAERVGKGIRRIVGK